MTHPALVHCCSISPFPRFPFLIFHFSFLLLEWPLSRVGCAHVRKNTRLSLHMHNFNFTFRSGRAWEHTCQTLLPLSHLSPGQRSKRQATRAACQEFQLILTLSHMYKGNCHFNKPFAIWVSGGWTDGFQESKKKTLQQSPFPPSLTFTHPYHKQVVRHLWCRWVTYCKWVNVRLWNCCNVFWIDNQSVHRSNCPWMQYIWIVHSTWHSDSNGLLKWQFPF